MSSYVNFYLLPKEGDKKLFFNSYCRGGLTYSYLKDELCPPYVDEDNPRKITADDIKPVIEAVNKDLELLKKRKYNFLEAIKTMGTSVEILEECVSRLDEYSEEKENLIYCKNELESIYLWMSDIAYSDFEGVYVDYD